MRKATVFRKQGGEEIIGKLNAKEISLNAAYNEVTGKRPKPKLKGEEIDWDHFFDGFIQWLEWMIIKPHKTKACKAGDEDLEPVICIVLECIKKQLEKQLDAAEVIAKES